MSLFKIPLLFVALWGIHVTNTPPVQAEHHEIRNDVPSTERVFRGNIARCASIIKLVAYTFCGCEAAVVLAHTNPTSPIAASAFRYMIYGPAASAGNIRMSLTFLVGWSVLVLGALLRLACYRELGRLFTFEVTLRRDHRLVTSGPYAVVRHPGYIGGIMVFAGMSTCIVGPGSWAMECGALDTRGGMALAATWMVSWTYIVAHALMRMPAEDRIMQEEFGKAWREWATRVPWRLIPGVY